VDLHSSLANMLDEFIGGRTSGFLFSTASGRPMTRQNIMNRHFNPPLEKLGLGRKGYHAFRRYRVTYLRKSRVPEDLIRFWIGHSDRNMTDGSSQLRADDKFRKEIAEAVGLGFDLPTSPAADCTGLGAEFAPNAPKIDSLELAVVP
jgi:integrase